MSNTQFKTRTLTAGPRWPVRVSLGIVAGGAPVVSGTLHKVFAAQDTAYTSGRRIVGVAHLHGSPRTEIPDSTDPDGVAHDYPYRDLTDDTVYAVRRWLSSWHVASGHDVEQWCVCLPAGPTEDDPSNAKNGEGGESVLSVQETISESGTPAQGESSAATTSASPLEFNGVPAGNTPKILRSSYSRTRIVLPSTSKGTQADLSESPMVYVSLDRQGAARIHSAVIAEAPRFYSRAHNADWSRASLAVYTEQKYPDTLARTKYPDGATFDEPRFGLAQAYATAVRQAAAAGPVLAQVCFDHPRQRGPDDSLFSMGLQIASGTSTMTNILNPALTTWDADEIGWPIAGYLAQPHDVSSHEATRGGSIAVVPVRVTVAYRSNGDAATLRVMSSARSFVDVSLASTAEGWASAVGYLESMRSAEDATPSTGGPVIQLFARTATVALDLLSVTVEYGHEPWQGPTFVAG